MKKHKTWHVCSCKKRYKVVINRHGYTRSKCPDCKRSYEYDILISGLIRENKKLREKLEVIAGYARNEIIIRKK